MSWKKNFSLVMMVLAVFCLSLCLSNPVFAAEEEDCEDPDTLTFSIIPTEETGQEVDLYQPLINFLSEKTGKEVEFYMPTSYSTVVEAQIAGWVDVAVHGPNSYVIAHEKDPDIEVFATYAKKEGHIQEEGPGYKSVLITKKGSGFDSIESLEGTIVGLTDPASTSGSLIPNAIFGKKELEMPLNDYFDKIVYTGGHDLSTLAVRDGKVDAAFVATHRFDNVIERGLAEVDDFNYLWESPTVPQDPFCYRKSLCPELKKNIRETFLNVHEVPEAEGFLDNVMSSRFVEMSDDDYDIVRELRRAKEEMEAPEGEELES